MDFEQIKAFIYVASLKSFSEAGEKLFISQPSVSVRIKALEEELGVILFDRSRAREPILTDAGRIFFDCAQSMLNLQHECREKLSSKREETGGQVFIGASTVPGIYLVPDLLADFKKLLPAAGYNISILDTGAVTEGILNYSFDLGFVGLINRDERLTHIPIYQDELVLCVRKALLSDADTAGEVSAEIMVSHNLLMREKGSATRRILEEKLQKIGLDDHQFSGIIYMNSLEGIKQAVSAGLGIAVVSSLSIQDMVSAGTVDTFRIANLDLRRSLYLVFHHSRILGPAAQKLKNFTLERFGGYASGQQ